MNAPVVIIGAGPAWLLPTATDDLLGGEQFAIGPSVVALKQSSGWTFGKTSSRANWFELGSPRVVCPSRTA